MISTPSRMAIAASSLVFCALSAAPAFASDPVTPADPVATLEAADAQGLGDIVVTAQKRAENLQTVPISMSVMPGDALVSRHVTSLLDLGDGSIPSLKIAPFYSRNSSVIVNIRGIG